MGDDYVGSLSQVGVPFFTAQQSIAKPLYTPLQAQYGPTKTFQPGNPIGGALSGHPDWMPDWMKSAVGDKNTPGWGGLALGAANTLFNGFMGMKQYGLAKDTLNFNKMQFNKNYDAQRNTTNAQMEAQQRARVAGDPAAMAVAEYMSKYGIKE